MTKAKKKEAKVIKCYYCGHVIENSHDHVIKLVPMSTKSGIRRYKRQLHLDCVSKYNEGLENVELRKEENSQWDLCYKYFRKDILGMSETESLPEHATKRILGLRIGSYYPQSQNVRILPRGYDFNVILLTMKVVNPKVQAYLKTANFANMKHKIDGVMKFIVGEIPDVNKRVETQKKANSKLFDDKKEEPSFDYKEALRKEREAKKQKEKDDSIANDIASLLGGSL